MQYLQRICDEQASAPRFSALVLCAAVVIMGATGCQAFAPAAIGSLTASREEKRVLRQAEVDPFPSPADVGLAAATPSKTAPIKR
jgi:hypothetical protein